MIRLFEPDEIFRSANDLRTIVRSSLSHWQSAIEQQHLDVSIELNSALPVACQAENTLPLINAILDLAIHRSPNFGELSIIGFRSHSRVELEIADSGPATGNASVSIAFSTSARHRKSGSEVERLDYQARSFGGRLSTLACPQGGIAWTLYLPSRAISKRAA